MSEGKFNIGKIVNTHGIRGEVKVVRITDFEDRFSSGNTVYLQDNQGEYKPLVIATHRVHKGFDLLQFKGYKNINEVEAFKGLMLSIDEDQLTDLEEGAYYYHEIVGCKVFTTDGEELGKVKEILSPGANDVWVVQRINAKDLLIPYIEQVVKEVDNENKIIKIQLMEGMLD
ncbi:MULTISPECIES: ribosome maturation factor RimM [Oceanobacillus]|uniref:ribosome maturation factor RimM n=1 Tax=Oceanobacillus TaxID=182709 RepID=UPI00034B856F|nr:MULTISPECIES: ribosome maturation factor RimM [Oceanobacillus]MBT2598732.1 ribosome maturation factor RimM [Oceanobacillus sp. ISL-74]MBT2651651.1 ribosome maturation factor RimM [Oceanobacillus sp. ISL-73]MCT1576300.1 ribosome maturation factor RimM [Oceanobacillus kimchii]MCT2135936.1 ribosome maturation factor RimM [Oceanobacillus kimchii]OEH54639.1 ribosome maturation factor RimM [Oceanobacillus sp. E9]